ncbi:MAG TPA: MerR family transcriptional regulator [Jiangellaceae bacterium]
MSWSINEVSRMAKVSSRTLRHYDSIDLLPPAFTDHSGRRFYGEDELLRLQQILLLRNLGLSLDAIAEVLAGQSKQSAMTVLRKHREWLTAERKRLGRLIKTVDGTIDHLEKGGEMAPESMFEGFEHNPYEAEARERWGDAVVDESNARLRNLSPEQAKRAQEGFGKAAADVRELRDGGAPVNDSRVQEAIKGLHEWLELFWTPNRESFSGLADMYVDDERFRKNIGRGDDAFVEYLRDAMKIYAESRLS